MAHEKRWRLICYDVRDPKRWRRVHKLLKGSGRTVQYSIFRCRLDDRELERLRWELAKLLAPEDSLLVVDLCPSCAGRVISRNHVEGWTDVEPSFVIWPPMAIQAPQAASAPPRAKRPKSMRSPSKCDRPPGGDA